MTLTRLIKLFFICIGLMFGTNLFAEEKLQAPLFDNLGNSHYQISTKVPLAQRFFDQGMVFYYGFEWGESIRSFTEAARLDPNCSMCYWGIALSLLSKINAPSTGHEYEDAKSAIRKALVLSVHVTPIERDYIKALSLRFQYPPSAKQRKGAFSCHMSNNVSATLDHKQMSDYLHAMKKITKDYPNDNQAKILYAVGLYWILKGHPSDNDPVVIESTNLVKNVLAKDKMNVGANHYFIHLIEPYSHPEQGMEAADRLNTLVPGSEHLVHMPAHIYFLTGRYHAASEANQHAINVFKQYNFSCRQQGFEPSINFLYLHNYDFLRSSAVMEGRKQLALSASQPFVDEPFKTWLSKNPSLEWFVAIPDYVKARFNMWDEILKESLPPANYYSKCCTMRHYARGLAFAHKGEIKKAREESVQLQKIIRRWNVKNNVLGTAGLNLASIANEILIAVLKDVEKNEKAVIQHLKKAIKIQDAMGYHEPPDWYFPVRQALADAYLKWGHPDLAATIYEEDLHQYPLNGWSLYGLAKSMRQLGKNREAEIAEAKFKEAWKYSDIPKPVSLFR